MLFCPGEGRSPLLRELETQMKTKLIVAAIVSALTLGAAATPALAHDFRGSDYNQAAYGYGDHDWRGRGQITVRTQRGQFSVDRDDRLFWRLTERPYRFRPGFTYVYTDRCNRDGCMVLEFSRWSRMPTDRFFAPYVRFDRVSWDRDDRWGQDDRDFRGPASPRDFDRRSDSRDFRGQPDDPRAYNNPTPQNNYAPAPNGGSQFHGNGYQGRDGSGLLGGPH